MTNDGTRRGLNLNWWAMAILLAQAGLFVEARAGRVAAQDAADAANGMLLASDDCIPAAASY